jgi:hypothetical protein
MLKFVMALAGHLCYKFQCRVDLGVKLSLMFMIKFKQGFLGFNEKSGIAKC